MIGNHSPDRNSRTKNTTLTTGAAASSFGISVLVAAPSAVKLSAPTTTANTNAPTLAGNWTLNANRPSASSTITSTNATSRVLMKIAPSSAQAGSGLSRSRFSSPVSRRLTSTTASAVKHADITP